MLQNGPADPALPQDTNDRKKRFEVYSAAKVCIEQNPLNFTQE